MNLSVVKHSQRKTNINGTTTRYSKSQANGIFLLSKIYDQIQQVHVHNIHLAEKGMQFEKTP